MMRSCDVPGQPPAPIGPWRAVPAPTTTFVDQCSAGGGLGFSLPFARVMSNQTSASLNLAAPTEGGGSIAFERFRVWANLRLATTGGPLRVDGVATTAGQPASLEHVSGGFDEHAPIEFLARSPVTTLGLVLTCGDSDRPRAEPAPIDCHAEADVPLLLRGIEVTLREEVAPRGSATGGTLLGELPVSGVRTLDYAVSDEESGVAKIEALIADKVAATKNLVGSCPYAGWAACPRADRDRFTVDTRNVPDGRYPVTLRIVDAAGNRRDEQVQLIDVRNAESAERPETPPRAEITAASPIVGATLTARFGRSPRSTVVVPFGRRVTVRGRLGGTPRAALAGARIDVLERPLTSGSREVEVGSTRTRSDGTFSYVLASARPSRVVRLRYGSTTTARALRINVRAASTLKATLTGTLVRFSGRILSRPVPPAGKRVILQGKAPGYAWTRFTTVRSDPRGSFAGSYRLRVRRPGVRLQIRALLPAERGHPYVSGRTKAVVLQVR